jgi:hypothetical protein
MDKLDASNPTRDLTRPRATQLEQPAKKDWETPTLEDVSEQVMAQPYIRFT